MASPVGRDEVVAGGTRPRRPNCSPTVGLAATSIRDIAARSKVNHGLIYRHFGTKEQLVGAVLDHLGAGLTTLLDEGGPADEIEHNHGPAHARDGQGAARRLSRWANYRLGFRVSRRLLGQVLPQFDDERSGTAGRCQRRCPSTGLALLRTVPEVGGRPGHDSAAMTMRAAMNAEIARILEPGDSSAG